MISEFMLAVLVPTVFFVAHRDVFCRSMKRRRLRKKEHSVSVFIMKYFLALGLFSVSLFATPLYQESFVAAPGFQPENHASSIVELPSGELMVCWYAGTREGASDVKIYCANSKDQGAHWTAPRVVVQSGEKAVGSFFKNQTVGNTALYLDEEKTLWLFYSAVVLGGWSSSYVDVKTSFDFGQTWSKGKRFVGKMGNLPRNKPIRLGVNQFFLPLYHEFISFQGYGCDLHVSKGKITQSECFDIPGSDHAQPAVALRGNKIYAYLRTRTAGAIRFSVFDRALKKWTNPTVLKLPNPDAAVEVEEDALGNLLLVYNDSTKYRTPLSLAISKEGTDFKKIWNFEEDPKQSFAYPAIRKGKGSDYYVSYTYQDRAAIKFIHFNEEWLRTKAP